MCPERPLCSTRTQWTLLAVGEARVHFGGGRMGAHKPPAAVVTPVNTLGWGRAGSVRGGTRPGHPRLYLLEPESASGCGCGAAGRGGAGRACPRAGAGLKGGGARGDWVRALGRQSELSCRAVQVSLRSAQPPSLGLVKALRPASPPPPLPPDSHSHPARASPTAASIAAGCSLRPTPAATPSATFPWPSSPQCLTLTLGLRNAR